MLALILVRLIVPVVASISMSGKILALTPAILRVPVVQVRVMPLEKSVQNSE